jgi:hypothetical protein
MGGGTRLLFAGICVRNAPVAGSYKVGRAASADACFPGDATVTRLRSGRPEVARMDELRIGDAVECLVPRGFEGTKAFNDGDQTYVPGVCHVFGYLDAHAVSLALALSLAGQSLK